MAVTIEITVTSAEAARWCRFTEEAGMDLSTWVRHAARRAERAHHGLVEDGRKAVVEDAYRNSPLLPLPPLDVYLAEKGDRFGDLPRA